MPVLDAFLAHVQDKTASVLQAGCENNTLTQKL
jgi:hypothetical protein